jgi:3-hydroxybutyryl-CoA dehydrogenase
MIHNQHSLTAQAVLAVVGVGSMGAGIAQVAAQAGHQVKLFDVNQKKAQQAYHTIAENLNKAVTRGQIKTEQYAEILARVSVADSLQALAEAELVIEAILEQVEAKRALFAALETIVKKETIFASNTSSLSITALAYGLKHPERVVGWHFFNPATRMQLVEIIPGIATDAKYLQSLHSLSKAWGKQPVSAPNTPGFIVNRVARPYYAESLRLLAENIAPIVTIDYVARECGGFAMGPFELIDLIGVEVNLSVTESVFAATAYDTRYAPHVLQQELVRAGYWGKKTDKGFYTYQAGKKQSTPITFIEAAPTSTMRLEIAHDKGLLLPLAQRLQQSGVTLSDNTQLPAETLQLQTSKGPILMALSDGRTAAACAAQYGMPVILLDLAHDFAVVSCLALTASEQAKTSLPELALLLKNANLSLIMLADIAGMVVMRLVSCLINEAADLITWTRTQPTEIDLAMRLGTAYPYGPFAWADQLGPQRVINCLMQLQNHYGDMRYRCAPKLKELRFSKGKFYG